LILLLFLALGNGRDVFGAICMGSGSYDYDVPGRCAFDDYDHVYFCTFGYKTFSSKYTCSWSGGSCGYWHKDSCRCVANPTTGCVYPCWYSGGATWVTSGCTVCTPVNGECGSADGGTFETTPTDLCSRVASPSLSWDCGAG